MALAGLRSQMGCSRIEQERVSWADNDNNDSVIILIYIVSCLYSVVSSSLRG